MGPVSSPHPRRFRVLFTYPWENGLGTITKRHFSDAEGEARKIVADGGTAEVVYVDPFTGERTTLAKYEPPGPPT